MSALGDRPVLVTGAAGFLARRLVAKLLRQGVRVRGMVRGASAAEELTQWLPESLRPGFETVRGDFVNPEDCVRAVQGIGVVYHLGAQLSAATAALFLTNVVGTKRLLAAAADAGASRVVLVSSIAVYDTQSLATHARVDETVPLDPQPHLRDPYTFSKVEQEQAAAALCRERGLPLVIVRPGVIYGEERGVFSGRVGLQMGRLVLAVFRRHALPYTHVDNCVEAIALSGSAPGVEGRAFNVVDDDAPGVSQVLRAYRRAGKRPLVVPMPYPLFKQLGRFNRWYHRRSQGQLPAVLTPYKVASMWKPLRYDNAAAKRALGWTPAPRWERDAA